MRPGHALAALVLLSGGAGAEHRNRGIPLPYPELLHPQPPLRLPEGFVIVQNLPATPSDSARINHPDEVGARIARCWSPPGSQAGKNISVTVRMSFRADGSVLGEPMITYASAPKGSAARADIVKSVRDAIAACAPLPFTAALGSAIAGRLFAIRFVSQPQKQKETPA